MGIPLHAQIVFILKQGPGLNQIRVFLYEAQTVPAKVGEYHSLADIMWLFLVKI